MEGKDDEKNEYLDARTLKKIIDDAYKNENFDAAAESFLLDMTNDFLTDVMEKSLDLAKSKSGSEKALELDYQDAKFVLVDVMQQQKKEKFWKISVPFRDEDHKTGIRKFNAEIHPNHAHRIEQIRKNISPFDKKSALKKT